MPVIFTPSESIVHAETRRHGRIEIVDDPLQPGLKGRCAKIYQQPNAQIQQTLSM